MTYSGNQLTAVTETGPNVALPESNDFKKAASASTSHYSYNSNGAMTKDLHKGITNISYNLLNLPSRLTIKKPQYFLTIKMTGMEKASSCSNVNISAMYNIVDDMYVVLHSFSFGLIGDSRVNELIGKKAYINLARTSDYKGIDFHLSFSSSFMYPGMTNTYSKLFKASTPKGLFNIDYLSEGRWYSPEINSSLRFFNSQVSGGKAVKHMSKLGSNNEF